MDATTIGALSTGLLFVALAAGIPVGMAMGMLGFVGMYLGMSDAFAFGQVRTLPFSVASNYGYAVLPLFVLMGVLAESAGITGQVFRAADAWLRSVRGGLYQVVVVGSAIFAAVSGSTTVNAVVFTRLAFPEMLKYGYSRSLSIGAIAAAGSFAAMIPPSITMVIYAIMTEQSVGQLLLAGIIPGVLSAAAYILGIFVLVRFRPELAPPIHGHTPLVEKVKALKWVWSIVMLLALVLGGIYAGIFPPSAAGAVGAFGVFCIAMVRTHGRFGGWLAKALGDAASISCVIFVILIGGLLFSRMLVITGVIDAVVHTITSVAGGQYSFLILVSIMYLILGCFIDTTSMMVVTLPFIFPIVQHYGIDPIWFGIVLVKLIEISVITPPVGINLFAVMSAVDRNTQLSHVIRGVTPFIALELLLLALLLVFPGLSTWLPQKMLEG